MGAMPGSVAKGPILKRLEGFLNSPVLRADGTTNFSAFNDMWATQPDLALSFGVSNAILNIVPVNDLKHVTEHWWNDSYKLLWYPQWHPIGSILRTAFLEAYQRCHAGGRQVRQIEFFWVCPGEQVEVALLEHTNAALLTFLLITPMPPVSRYAEPTPPFTQDDEIVTIRFTDLGAGEVEISPGPAGTYTHVIRERRQAP